MKDDELKIFDSYARGVLNALVSNPFISEKIFDTLSEDAADDWIAEKTIKITKQLLKKRNVLLKENESNHSQNILPLLSSSGQKIKNNNRL